MIPSLSPLSNESASCAGGVQVSPPPYFKPIAGRPRSLFIGWSTEYERRRGNSAAKQNGLRYEERVQKLLDKTFPTYLVEPVMEFRDDNGLRICRPDGLLLLKDRIVLFEIKIRHMPEAWWQMRKLYQPILEVWEPATPVQCIEVVKSYDPAMPFPEPIELIEDVVTWTKHTDTISKFGVLVWPM